jgi:Flp pilus assembly protein TadG
MTNANRENGAIIVTVAMTLLFLLGFMAIAMDFGHLFVVKTELQSAADSCALAAVQELDGGSDALTRATNAGRTVGNLNRVNFQGASVGFVDTDITFSSSLTGTYSRTEPVATARYAKCIPIKDNMQPWLLQAMGAFSGEASYKAKQSVVAVAVATRASAQSVCNAIPVQIKPKVGGAAPNFGFTPGEWIPALYNENANNSAPTNGMFGWANLDGSTNAAETKAEILGNGPCNLRVGNPIGTPGSKVAASTEWNTRFGLYVNGAGNPKITDAAPDLTGYAYRAKNWPSQNNAVGDFLAKRADFRSYGNLTDTVSSGNTITGLSINNNYKDNLMGTHAAGPRALATFGKDRRLVIAPFVSGTTITDWACLLILHPIDGPNVTVFIEYVGNAGSITSPCANAGLAGGTSGPLVPALVQ